MFSGLFAKYPHFPIKRHSSKHMKKTITVMFYNGMKKQMFLHNFKNIIYGGGESNVKNIIYVGENPRTHRRSSCRLGHLFEAKHP